MTDNDKAIVELVQGHLDKLEEDGCRFEYDDPTRDREYKAYEARKKRAYDELKVCNPDIVVNILTHPTFFLNEQIRYADDVNAVLKAFNRKQVSGDMKKAIESRENFNRMMDMIEGKDFNQKDD